MTIRRIEDDEFNSGWNAALDAAIERIKKLPAEKVADDGVTILVTKASVIALLRDDQ